MMNGRIWIESKPGEGTSAIFIFKYGECEDKPDIKASNSPQAPLNLQIFSGKTILIAEDVEINREVMSILLEDTGRVIEFASNGVEAVSMFRESPDKYDIIIMDIQMPDMDGYDATRAIRSIGTEEAMAIPIIALTANVFKEDIEKCLEAGMNSHLGKPVDFDAMIGTLGEYL
jgi:CheY-like chemotaxis protein